ncbi:MAG: UDP-N-acetylmuramoyl-tripeptide--D-alanyl-D-alanine ligase [Candidatus Eisenbacteria bacterium]|nr:UDP-N-acetylmuramoyl-tripeptide--D-alanyl-D-alanine ligase [Candidatus Eisenbacteria bacterium]
MERILLSDMAEALNIPIRNAAGVRVGGVSTDSRTVRPGDLFFAIRGGRFDGHAFVADALRKGAVAAVVSDVGGSSRGPLLLVDDTVDALLTLAGWYRNRFELPIVAVTGSNGKTTTKDMIASVLSTRFRTAKTSGNYNNHIGVPLTLFDIEAAHQSAVVEIGMNHLGEIARLAAAVRPKVGVITNVSAAHMETMRNVDTVAQAKAELIEALPPDGTAVLNWDDPRVKALWARGPSNVVSFGMSPDAEVRAINIKTRPDGVSFELADGGRVELPVPGSHNVMNALAAIAVGRVMGVPDEAAADGLSVFQPSAMRMHTARVGQMTILNDAYNCNPGSLRAALAALKDVAAGRPTAAALGDMLELGETSEEAHREAGATAARLGVDYLFLFGEEVKALSRGATENGIPPERVHIYEDKAALAEAVRSQLPASAVLLVKGSRGMRMEEVVESLMKEAPASDSAGA